jgi:uncharacterized protein RhaS with RHS repeats
LQKRGQRYYSPTLGRWLSSDPIEEEGGVNVYVFVGNQPISCLDDIGLKASIYPDSDTDASVGRLSEVNTVFNTTHLQVVRTVAFYRAIKESLLVTRATYAESDFAINGGSRIGELRALPAANSDPQLQRLWRDTYRHHRYQLNESDQRARWWADAAVRSQLDQKQTTTLVPILGVVSMYHSHPPSATKTAVPSPNDYETLRKFHEFNDSHGYSWQWPYYGFVSQPVLGNLQSLKNVTEAELVIYSETDRSGRNTGIFISWCE